MSTLDLCEKYFQTRDIYKLLDLQKDAQMNEIKKSYHKMSLLVHPDRVHESQKAEATTKFQVLSRIYQVLTDDTKRALYDKKGIIDREGDDDSDKDATFKGKVVKLDAFLDEWRKTFHPFLYHKSKYVGSVAERDAIKKAYLDGRGSIKYIIKNTPFLDANDGPRVHKVVCKMIQEKLIPPPSHFTGEPPQMRAKPNNAGEERNENPKAQ
ncbi:J domain-containing protein CG6693-like [Scaptodrosophila lebanonensis]|uniref:J domain-containing protein CG6693-like n=1 Tax=Drosophila lebanonensis TaxID=7225 RepID=A0A6J2TWL9_DROLE|nr:J domain-containing protein CG6693-like [Scaptodrosophila lebanonensis]XP_030380924.1 J domain-containing protein CG6693-like [Scaptodrosophila lebanonensis]